MRLLGIVPFIAIASISAQAAPSEEWIRPARRLTGESDQVREESLSKLRKIKNLPTILKEALPGPNRPLALDVAAALNLHSLLPDLLSFSQQDESGATYLAINSLATDKDWPTLKDLYHQRAVEPGASIPVRMILIDTLARLRVRVSEAELGAWLIYPHYEVRSAALYYVRYRMVKFGEDEWAWAVEKASEDPDRRIRIQAAHLTNDLPPRMKSTIKFHNCAVEQDPEVESLCLKFGLGKKS